jgi:hypothetical protein
MRQAMMFSKRGTSAAEVQAAIAAADPNPQAVNILPIDPRVGGASTLTANRAYFVKFTVDYPRTIGAITLYISVATSGNVDVGVYQGNATLLTRLASSGSTPTGPINTAQKIALSSTITVVPGVNYYLALAADNATVSVGRFNGGGNQMSGMDDMALAKDSAAFPLPASVVPNSTSLSPILMASPS